MGQGKESSEAFFPFLVVCLPQLIYKLYFAKRQF